MDFEHRVNVAFVQGEEPVADYTGRAQRVNDAVRNNVLQAKVVNGDGNAVCPRAMTRPDKAVTAFFRRQFIFAIAKRRSELRFFRIRVFLATIEVRRIAAFVFFLFPVWSLMAINISPLFSYTTHKVYLCAFTFVMLFLKAAQLR